MGELLVGLLVGVTVGLAVGIPVGGVVGLVVGAAVGETVGIVVGRGVGCGVGCHVYAVNSALTELSLWLELLQYAPRCAELIAMYSGSAFVALRHVVDVLNSWQIFSNANCCWAAVGAE